MTSIAADAGKQATLEFTPTQAGTYTIYCTVAGHKEAGVTGIRIKVLSGRQLWSFSISMDKLGPR